jgi:hypothetical protein
MNYKQISEMAERFCAMELPKDFDPDGCIKFAHPINEQWPTGTNLFTIDQVIEIFRKITDGLFYIQEDSVDGAAEDALWDIDKDKILELRKLFPLATAKMLSDASGIRERCVIKILESN